MTNTDPRAVQWFRRTTGSWTSERRYLFNLETGKPTNMTTEFSIVEEPRNRFVVTWKGNTKGTMELHLEGDLLHRSRDYFDQGQDGHASRVSVIDEDTIVLHTHYNGLIFREEIRLLKSDTYRLRQTVGFCDKTGVAKIVGQYFETRI